MHFLDKMAFRNPIVVILKFILPITMAKGANTLYLSRQMVKKIVVYIRLILILCTIHLIRIMQMMHFTGGLSSQQVAMLGIWLWSKWGENFTFNFLKFSNSISIQNLLKAIRNGFAEGVDFHAMTTEIIKENLKKILEYPKYYANAKKISVLYYRDFRDQKETSLERVIWWT